VSFGPNQLIKQGAKLVTGWEDVVEELPTPVRAELLPVDTRSSQERATLVNRWGQPSACSTIYSTSMKRGLWTI
jgi:predicted Rossmann fold nucleotide-binding protein DprA/Smf involved in DNA uptake